MRIVFNKSVTVDEKRFEKNQPAWLRGIERYTEKNNGAYMYLIEVDSKLYSVDKKYFDFD